MFSLATSLVAAQPGGQGKAGAMRDLGIRTSILFLGIELCLIPLEVMCKQEEQGNKEWA